MKKIIAIVLLLCLLVALVACTGGEKPGNNNNNGEKPTATESETLAPGYVEEETWAGPEIDID